MHLFFETSRDPGTLNNHFFDGCIKNGRFNKHPIKMVEYQDLVDPEFYYGMNIINKSAFG